MFFSKNENNDVEIIIPSNVTNHIATALSVQIMAITYFSKMMQPLVRVTHSSALSSGLFNTHEQKDSSSWRCTEVSVRMKHSEAREEFNMVLSEETKQISFQ